MVGHFLQPRTSSTRSSSSSSNNQQQQQQQQHHPANPAVTPANISSSSLSLSTSLPSAFPALTTFSMMNGTNMNNTNSNDQNNSGHSAAAAAAAASANSVAAATAARFQGIHYDIATSSSLSKPSSMPIPITGAPQALPSISPSVPPLHLSAEAVAALPPPGLSGPTSIVFSPRQHNHHIIPNPKRYLVFVSSSSSPSASVAATTAASNNSKACRRTRSAEGTPSSSRNNPTSATPPTPGSHHPYHYPQQQQQQQQQPPQQHPYHQQQQRHLQYPPSTTITGSLSTSSERQLCCLDLQTHQVAPLLRLPSKRRFDSENSSLSSSHANLGSNSNNNSNAGGGSSSNSNSNANNNESMSLDERLRRERQRLNSSGGLTQFSWSWHSLQPTSTDSANNYKPHNPHFEASSALQGYTINDKSSSSSNNHYSSNSSNVNQRQILRLLVPIRGSLYIQDGLDAHLKLVYDKHTLDIPRPMTASSVNSQHAAPNFVPSTTASTGAIDPQLSPDASLFAFCAMGEIFVGPCNSFQKATPITFGADLHQSITHGLADFVAQEEMDRYRGFWWAPDSSGILFARVDESQVPTYRITHQESSESLGGGGVNGSDPSSSTMYEDHRYPFAGKNNPTVQLGYLRVDRASLLNPIRVEAAHNQHFDHQQTPQLTSSTTFNALALQLSKENWNSVIWFDAPREATEYLARITWMPDGSVCAQWQNRQQNCLVLQRIDIHATLKASATSSARSAPPPPVPRRLLVERSNVWINLHHMMYILERPIHPDECDQGLLEKSLQHNPLPSPLPDGSFSFLFASERTGFCHLYLYTFVPGRNNEQALLVRTVSSGKWMVESITGVDVSKNVVYVTGTYDSVLERHLYALPLLNASPQLYPIYKNPSSGTGPSASRLSLARSGSMESGSDSSRHYGNRSTRSMGRDYDGDHVMDTSHGRNDVSSGGNGVRRGLKQVINVLSGKSSSGGNSQSANERQPAASSSSKSERANPAVAFGNPFENGPSSPIRLTLLSGMHSIVMDPDCTMFVDTSSDLGRPTSVKIYKLPSSGIFVRNGSFADLTYAASPHPESSVMGRSHGSQQQSSATLNGTASINQVINNGNDGKAHLLRLPQINVLYDAVQDDHAVDRADPTMSSHLPQPELLELPSSDGIETLHAAIYRPDPRIHGPGPYPLICAVYGGPHVQRVNRSWSQCADMRAQRLRSMGFCVVKCDNRGSSRRGLAFESAISRRLGRLEVLDQVAIVRQLVVRGIADPTRVGIYGWSYGGYLSAMCLCRAPDVFHAAVAGAPVTSWDGYDTHYTERYMGIPNENPNGYRESAVFDHVPNMRGKLLLVHGLIDENVHFRHTARLVNRLIAAGKDYDLLLFPDERHSPRRLRDRIYMEQRISDYFLRHLGGRTMKALAGL